MFSALSEVKDKVKVTRGKHPSLRWHSSMPLAHECVCTKLYPGIANPLPSPPLTLPLISDHVCAMHKAHDDEERPAIVKRILFESFRQALKDELDWLHVEWSLKLNSISETPVTQTKPVEWWISRLQSPKQNLRDDRSQAERHTGLSNLLENILPKEDFSLSQTRISI